MNFDPYWDNNYIIMRRNKSYSESSYVYPYSLNFFITGDSSSDAANFGSGNVDCYISGPVDEKILSANNASSSNVKTAGLVFNLDSKYFGSRVLREALAKSINRDAYSHSLPEGLTAAFGIVPDGITIQGKSYRDIIPDRTLSVYDAGSFEMWERALDAIGAESLDSVKITVPDSFLGNGIIYDITGRWQNDLLFYCGVEIVSQNEYESKLEEGNYDIALVEISCDENSAYELLRFFADDKIFGRYSNSEFISSLNGIKTSVSLTSGAERINKAESEIIGDYVFIPICYEREYLIYSKNSADLAYYPFTSSVWFGEAKCFD